MLRNFLSRINFSQGASVSALALLLCLAFVPGAQANLLPPGPPVTAAPDIFGFVCPGPNCPTFVATTGLTGFVSTTGSVTGNYIASVYRDTTNPGGFAGCAGGCLDFVYQVFTSRNSPEGIGRVTAANFGAFLVDAGYDATGGTDFLAPFVNGGVVPQLIDRVGGTIGFAFATPNPNLKVAPGQNSVTLIISTNATAYTNGFFNIIDGSTFTGAAFQPAAVPEPASFALFGGGLLALAGIRRFRRKA